MVTGLASQDMGLLQYMAPIGTSNVDTGLMVCEPVDSVLVCRICLALTTITTSFFTGSCNDYCACMLARTDGDV